MSNQEENDERKRKSEAFDKRVEEFQRKNFDSRYIRSSMSELLIPLWASERILKFMDKPMNMLLFHGKPGCGKTRFCASIISWALSKFNTVRYHKDKDLIGKLKENFERGTSWEKDLEYKIDDDLVILDDVASGLNPSKLTYANLEWRIDVFFHFLDFRYNNQKPTIMTSNFSREDFHDIYSERVTSRLFASENIIIPAFSDEFVDLRQEGK